MNEDREKTECYCQVCDKEIIGVTAWMKHIETEPHFRNVIQEISQNAHLLFVGDPATAKSKVGKPNE